MERTTRPIQAQTVEKKPKKYKRVLDWRVPEEDDPDGWDEERARQELAEVGGEYPF